MAWQDAGPLDWMVLAHNAEKREYEEASAEVPPVLQIGAMATRPELETRKAGERPGGACARRVPEGPLVEENEVPGVGVMEEGGASVVVLAAHVHHRQAKQRPQSRESCRAISPPGPPAAASSSQLDDVVMKKHRAWRVLLRIASLEMLRVAQGGVW